MNYLPIDYNRQTINNDVINNKILWMIVMDLISLIYFKEIAKERSFTKAARNLYSSQQCMSQHVKKLETYYGVRFLERSPTVKLTDAGELLLSAIDTILETEENLRARLSYISQTQTGTLKFGLPSGRAHGILPAIIPDFQKEHPNVLVVITEGTSKVLEDKLLDGSIDIAVCSESGDSRKNNPALEYIQLCTERLFLLTSDSLLEKFFSDDLESVKDRFHNGAYMRELMDLPVVMDPKTSRSQAIVNELYIEEGRKPNFAIASNRGSSILSLCNSGYCAVFLLEMILNASLKDDPDIPRKVNIIPLLDQKLRNNVVLITRKNRTETKYSTDFIDIIKRKVPELCQKHDQSLISS